ncbi:hypothetical protein GQ55_6G046900 [Panicum hallii var. hallii]|uniref:Uncharacterized protein n=1 Tax=Panicum hallii var. hallii TaxID=1504633 RepID=A0A2T7D3W0_9POAL|nr:hypothetical protein GQ55_6G046900 [Panicum hallii var. hallii]
MIFISEIFRISTCPDRISRTRSVGPSRMPRHLGYIYAWRVYKRCPAHIIHHGRLLYCSFLLAVQLGIEEWCLVYC